MLAMTLCRMTARQYRDLGKPQHLIALVGDNKGLHTAVQSANPITTKGEKRLTIYKVKRRD